MHLMQKIFFKKTRRGKILKVVREHYLREDIPCRSQLCEECYVPAEDILLEKAPQSRSTLFTEPHYVMLDANVILDQIDVLESPEGLSNVILVQTVLEEVRHRSSPIYKRLMDVVHNDKRHFVVFINEHQKDTFCERQPGESANDRNDRALRTCARWLQVVHWENRMLIVLITDDAKCRELAANEGIANCRIADYVGSMTAFPALADKLCARESAFTANKKALFPEHLSPGQINAGIKNGTLVQGVFYLNRTNFLEGSVSSDSQSAPILIQGLENQNRAVDGDHVAIQLLPKDEWSAPAEIVIEDEGYDPGDTLDEASSVLKAAQKEPEVKPTGKVVGIIKRKWRQYCGILQLNPLRNSNRHIFVPAEKKIPKIRIDTKQSESLKGQRIIVSIDSWSRHSRYPMGHFVRTLGPIGNKETENEVILLEHDIPHSTFSETVLQCLPKLPWTITAEDIENRVDLRHLDICSVDPPGCTDIDDALHCQSLANGNYEVGVHIADVSHFIKPNTAIDQEAANRATTVYLTDRRIDMVPELLSSNLCSLRGGEERFAFSCVWEMDKKANIISTKFHKSIIKSRKAMTYEEAQNTIDDVNDKSKLAVSLRKLLRLSKLMKERRMQRGALLLASAEIRFDVDSETADPIDVQAKVTRDTNSMVEEFMLAANVSAAERIFSNFPECAMLRRHPAPPPSNFDPLVKAGKQQGFEIRIDDSKALADSLNEALDPANPYLNTMLRMIATRCMMQAVYFASGSLEEPLFAHYGLACPIYTHFTSPIRRYADVIVHRLLAVSISADSTYAELVDKKVTEKIANNINYRHRMALYASRASVNLHTHIFFRNKRRDETAYILFVRQNALQVLIPKYGLEGTLYLRGDDVDQTGPSRAAVSFVFDDQVPCQTCQGVTLKLFQKIKVQLSLDQSNVQHEKLIVRLVEPRIDGFSVEPVGGEDAEVTQVDSGSSVSITSPPERLGRKRVSPLASKTSKAKKKKSR